LSHFNILNRSNGLLRDLTNFMYGRTQQTPYACVNRQLSQPKEATELCKAHNSEEFIARLDLRRQISKMSYFNLWTANSHVKRKYVKLKTF